MADRSEITGIVLCGGRSSRMGTDKGLCLLRGRPLIEHAIDLLRPFCSAIILSAPHDAYSKFECRVVPDVYPGIGPLGGLYSSLCASVTNFNLVIACDMPMVPAGLISMLMNQVEDYDAVVPCYNGRIEPLCAFYNKKLSEAFDHSVRNKKYKLQEIIQGLNVKLIDVEPGMPFYHDNIFMNVNSMDQLWAIEKNLK